MVHLQQGLRQAQPLQQWFERRERSFVELLLGWNEQPRKNQRRRKKEKNDSKHHKDQSEKIRG